MTRNRRAYGRAERFTYTQVFSSHYKSFMNGNIARPPIVRPQRPRRRLRTRKTAFQLGVPSEIVTTDAATNHALARIAQLESRVGLPRGKPRRRNRSRARAFRRTGPNGSMKTLHNVEPCTLHYASALLDPEYTPCGACIPYGYPQPSQKAKAFLRGKMVLGTTGFGFCLFTPPLGNDTACIATTTSTSVGGVGNALNTYTNQTNFAMAKLPFTSAQLTNPANPLTGRFVAGLVKVRYAGTEAGRNGTVLCLEEPDHNSLVSSNFSIFSSDINGLNERPMPEGQWHTVKWSGPRNRVETEYTASAAGSSGCMLLFASGTAGDVYDIEAYCHCEYVGTPTTGSSSTGTDMDGYSKVMSVVTNAAASEPLNDFNFKGVFTDVLSSLGTSAGNLVKQHGIRVLSEMMSPTLANVGRNLLEY